VQTVIVTALRRVGCITPMNTGSAMIASNSGFKRAHSISPRVHFPRWEHRPCNAWIVSECVVSGPLIRNDGVGGSNPSCGTRTISDLREYRPRKIWWGNGRARRRPEQECDVSRRQRLLTSE
jgi:hypothetical protein